MKSFRSLTLRLVGATTLWALASSANAVTVFDYRFDGGTPGQAILSVVDSGPNGFNGNVVGPMSYQAPGPQGGTSAANMRGDLNYAAVASNAAMNLQEFTLFADVRPLGGFGTGNINTSRQVSFVAKRAQFNNCTFCDSWGLTFDIVTNRFSGFIAQNFNGNSSTGVFLTSQNTFAKDQWHSVSLSLDRDVSGTLDRLVLYVDGVQEATAMGDWGSVPFYDGPRVGNLYSDLLIGGGNYGGTNSIFRRNLDGDIDNVRLINTPVPEPGTWVLMLAGLLGMAAVARRRRTNTA